MKKIFLTIVTLAFSVFLFLPEIEAQVLDYEDKIEIVLSDQTNLILYGEPSRYGTSPEKKYYYLPSSSSLKLGTKPDGTPEFLFLKYTTEEREDQGGVQGAITHFLVEWGLTKKQETELSSILKTKHGGAKLGGPVELLPKEKNSFSIISATLTDKTLTPNFSTSGLAPPLPGGKAAVAARLDKNGAQLLAATFEKSRSISDVSLALNYEYALLAPSVKGEIVFDFRRFDSVHEGELKAYVDKKRKHHIETYDRGLLRRDGKREVSSNKAYPNVNYESQLEWQWRYEYCEENQFITMEYFEPIKDERLNIIREAFFEMFLNVFSDTPDSDFDDEELKQNDGNDSKDASEKKQRGKDYYSLSFNTSKRSQYKYKKISLNNIRLTITRQHQIVGNLASWYDGVRHNKKCVSTVNLNDPFFQHRDINMILDLEAEEMFGKEVNYVTVNVRKKRSKGNDFSDAITIDRTYLETNGTLANLTYSRGEDKSPDLYEYKSQWSLRGGELYPKNPRWVRGDWQGITLAAPVTPRTIEFEGDLENMKAQKIRRATLQVRYQKYGKEFETNIPLTVSKKQPLVSETIFMDREAPGYATRLVLTHEEKGKLADPEWKAQFNDDYVFASIPELEGANLKKWLEAAKELLGTPKAGEKEITNPTLKILDKVLKAAGAILGE